MNIRTNLEMLATGTCVLVAIMAITNACTDAPTDQPAPSRTLTYPIVDLVVDENYETGFHTLTIYVDAEIPARERSRIEQSGDMILGGYQGVFLGAIRTQLKIFMDKYPHCRIQSVSFFQGHAIWLGQTNGGGATLPSSAFVTLDCGKPQ